MCLCEFREISEDELRHSNYAISASDDMIIHRESWNWSNDSFVADKRVDKGERGSSSGFANCWSAGDESEDEAEDDLFPALKTSHKRKKMEIGAGDWYLDGTRLSGQHQSTFERIIESEHERQTDERARAAVFSEELTPIEATSKWKWKGKEKSKSRARFNEMFQPLACSTPKSHAPILSIIETFSQLTGKSRVIREQNQMEASQDLLGGLFKSQTKQSIMPQPVQIKVEEVSAEVVIQDEALITTQEYPSLTQVPEQFPISPLPMEVIDKEKEPLHLSKRTETYSVQFEDEDENDLFNLIPHVLITSYTNSVNDNNNSAVVQSQAMDRNVEAKRQQLISAIEGIILETVRSINVHQRIDPNILSYVNPSLNDNRKRQGKTGNKSLITRKHFNNTYYVLGEIYKILRSRTVCNKRELYYKHPETFVSYEQLCTVVANVGKLLNCAPWEMGIVSTSKSLVAGPLKIGNSSGDLIDFTDAIGEGMPLPNDFHLFHYLKTTAKFVLLVEKETVFKRLINDDIFSRLGYEFLLVTGRGQGDLTVRMFLNRIANEGVPIFGLFDADPYGIEILLTYQCGSVKMVRKAEELTVPSIKWIGVYPSEIEALNLVKLPLSGADNKRINDMLNRQRCLPGDVEQQLRVAKGVRAKTEIEGLYDLSDNYLIDEYLANKIKENLSM